MPTDGYDYGGGSMNIGGGGGITVMGGNAGILEYIRKQKYREGSDLHKMIK